MLRRLCFSIRQRFSTPKQQYAKYYVVKIKFGQDGFYESNQYRPDFIQKLKSYQKDNSAIILGGDSYPFGLSTFYINCDGAEVAQKIAKENVFVKNGLATESIEEIERISSNKFGNIANFYQMKIPL